MDNLINNLQIKYDIENYKYIDSNIDINEIPIGTHIIYIKKKNFNKKCGYLKEIKDTNIIVLKNNRKYIFYLYINEYYLFYKEKNKNKLKDLLKNLVDTDFLEVTTILKSNKGKKQ
jgi:hypothetical protein